MENRPRGREKHVTDNSKGVYKRGQGLGTGPVGGRTGVSGRSTGTRSASPLTLLIFLAMLVFGGGGGLLSSFFGGSDSTVVTSSQNSNTAVFTAPVASSSASAAVHTSTASLDTSVAKGARDKYTTIYGNNKDQTTLMIYMCGTDLESKSGMATSDLQEIAKASTSDQINIIVYTGGCTQWRVSGISNRVNQIYQIKNGSLYVLEKDMGSKSMTSPDTLKEFLNYGKKNFPATRYDLIMWDHGGGSISGYGYDENYAKTGSMTLAGIDEALSAAGIKFDFIGFDACLMATAENALMLNEYADYLIASEETEPGIGWYYTEWLNQYAKNPSMSTLEIGKNIIDGFVTECSSRARGQSATLSIIDLAEFSATVPEKLKAFSKETTQMIQDKQYKTIASARQNSREFAQAKIDQVDMVDLLKKLNTDSSNDLADALLNAVKYNRTSSNMSNAYGVSIYFPNKNLNNVDTAVSINDTIGVNEEYNDCMKEYASLQLAGQTVAQSNGYTGNPYASLIGELLSAGTGGSTSSSDILGALLSAGLNSMTANKFVQDRSMSDEETALYLSENMFDASQLVWKQQNGQSVISLSEEQWSLVTQLEANMFYNDGAGYIDLGYDNVFEFDDEGNLVADQDETWIAINGQPVAYYHTSTAEFGNDEYAIQGYVPAYLNGERVNLLLQFDSENPYGFIVGTISDYKDGETATSAKVDGALEAGDVLEFVCDYYDYQGNYQDSYYLGEAMTVTDTMEISNVRTGDGAMLTYKFTDIYGQEYWTPVVE